MLSSAETSQDDADKAGTASLAANLLDEGAGELDSKAYHERLENHAIELGFQVGRDYFHGSLRALNEHREEAFDLLHLALTAPRFDADAVERVRGQVLSLLRRDSTNPNKLASDNWWQNAFPDHPYGRSSRGTLESVPHITAGDLRGYVRRAFARNGLTISIVGDIDPKTAGALIDRAFAGLPAKNDVKDVPKASPHNLGRRIVIPLDVPQAVVTFGGQGIARNDPDFMAGLYRQPYSGRRQLFLAPVSGSTRKARARLRRLRQPVWFRSAAVVIGGTATPADRTGDALKVIEHETKRMAESGPTPEELAAAKSYLKGAYALALDTSNKIAAQLTQIQLDELGIDYIAAPQRTDRRRDPRRRQAGGQAPLRRRHAGHGRRPAQGAEVERRERVNRLRAARVSGANSRCRLPGHRTWLADAAQAGMTTERPCRFSNPSTARLKKTSGRTASPTTP